MTIPLESTQVLRPVPAPLAPALPPATSDVETVPVLDIPLAALDYERAMDVMDAMIARGERGYVSAVAVHLLMVAQEDEAVRDAVLGASLLLPDGMPLVWAMNALGTTPRLDQRVYGPDLMDRHCARAARNGTRVYLYGGRNEGALVQLTLELRRRHPGIRIVGGYSPPFRPLEADERNRVVDEINRTGADVVWVGTGQPKQELWMHEMRPLLEAPVLVGVGAAFDFHAGLVPQAPRFMQDSGLEWVYRLSKEPRRLWRRYLRYNPRFVTGFARQYVSARHDARAGHGSPPR